MSTSQTQRRRAKSAAVDEPSQPCYTLDEVAQTAAMKALEMFAPKLAQLDNAIRELSVRQERTDDMSKYKARVKERWICAETLQDLVQKAIEAQLKMPAAPLFREYADQFIATYKSNGSIQLNTLIGYRGYLNNHLYPYFGDKPINIIDTAEIQTYINAKSETLSKKTIKEHLQLLGMIMDAAVEDALIPKNPCASKRLQVVGKSSAKVSAYSEEEYKSFESLLPKLPETPRLFLALSLYTGMRQGEMFALRWENIDLSQHIIHVCVSAEWPSQNQPIIKPPKTENGIRDIPIVQQLASILNRFKKTNGYVLRGRRQKEDLPMTRQAVKRLNDRLNQLAAAHGIETRFLSHRARHSVATILNNIGADDVSITSVLGHADVSFTKRQYVTSQTPQVQKSMSDFSDHISNL